MIVSVQNSCWGTYVSGHSHVCAQWCEHNHVWAQMCLGINVSGHKRVWAQSCVGTVVSGHKRVGFTIVSGHNRVWAQSCGHSRVGIIMYGHKRDGTEFSMCQFSYGAKFPGVSFPFTSTDSLTQCSYEISSMTDSYFRVEILT